MDPRKFKQNLSRELVKSLSAIDEVHAIWEAGSAANGTSDDFSDIDFNILSASSPEIIFGQIETVLQSISPVTHVYHEPKTIWPELTQKIYILKDSPKHFFLDVALFPDSAENILKEFLQRERHGTPVVHYDKFGQMRVSECNREEFDKRHRQRLADIVGCFPVYRTTVFKELDRGNPVDAFAFYQGGMVRPLVELLGMLHRPFRFDFGLRYLKRSLPPALYEKVQRLIYVSDSDDLKAKAMELEKLFQETVDQLSARFKS